MAIGFTTFVKRSAGAVTLLLANTLARGQEVQTLELSTSVVHPISARLSSASLIQVPVEPVATNVGDPSIWLVEKAEKIISIKPTAQGARDTNLAIITRMGTLNFSIHLVPDTEAYTQMIRVTKILDDSKPLPPQTTTQETLSDVIIHEIRVAQNFYALKLANSPELRNVEQVTQLRETGTTREICSLLQTFRFKDSRHVLLHFITENKGEAPVTFDQRRTSVLVGDTFFSPIAVSLGQLTLAPKASAENFLVLNGSTGLSPRQKFGIILEPIRTPENIPVEAPSALKGEP